MISVASRADFLNSWALGCWLLWERRGWVHGESRPSDLNCGRSRESWSQTGEIRKRGKKGNNRGKKNDLISSRRNITRKVSPLLFKPEVNHNQHNQGNYYSQTDQRQEDGVSLWVGIKNANPWSTLCSASVNASHFTSVRQTFQEFSSVFPRALISVLPKSMSLISPLSLFLTKSLDPSFFPFTASNPLLLFSWNLIAIILHPSLFVLSHFHPLCVAFLQLLIH